jgi:hypothetical protein
MENLVIEHRGQSISRKVIGCLWIIIAIGSLCFGKKPPEQKDWVISIIFFILGILHFTSLLGSTRSQIEVCDGSLKIIWRDWIRTVVIPESEIQRIILGKDGVKIYRTDKKPVKILFFYMDKEDKNKIYDYFTRYAREKNFVLEK